MQRNVWRRMSPLMRFGSCARRNYCGPRQNNTKCIDVKQVIPQTFAIQIENIHILMIAYVVFSNIILFPNFNEIGRVASWVV